MSGAVPGGGITAVRGEVVTFVDDPFLRPAAECLRHLADGVVVIEDGVITRVAAASELLPGLGSQAELHEFPDCLLMPGLIDTHVHYVQSGIVGSHGEGLLGWLDRYAFPAEEAFADRRYAEGEAERFCDRLIENGTTSALVFCAVFPGSVDALFEAAARRNLRLIAGKVLMDRNAPEVLLDTPESGYADSKDLIERWHGRGRALYAITPRFAPTSSPEQLQLAGTLRREHPEVYVHSHLAESESEVAWVRELFPERDHYLDVYDQYGLLGHRSIYAHGVQLCESEFARCHATGTALAHCPGSNLFLGSGLFPLAVAKDRRRPIEVGVGTDVGGGPSFSLLETLADGYKVARLAGGTLDGVSAFYLATLGGARALDLEGTVGSLQQGCEGDLVVLDPQATPVLAERTGRAEELSEVLFALAVLGDERAVRATFVAGVMAHRRDTA